MNIFEYSYNGHTITYDKIGNPLNYRDGFSFGWSGGRKLTTVYLNNGSVYVTGEYRYDDNGIRDYKSVNGNITRYYLNGSTILAEETNYGGTTRRIDYIYDETGSIYGFLVGGKAYYYQKNLQGDITGILDANGSLLVEYIYDAYGVPTTRFTGITDSLSDLEKQEIYILGSNNPFRYRGYYYDTETGFYYLNSRYYDPQTGRFLNADGYASTGQGVLCQNMFAYCGNNPINRADPSGQFWISALIKIVAVVVAVIVVAEIIEDIISADDYNHNSSIDADESTTTRSEIIDNQDSETIKQFEYGLCHGDYNACEAIAIHNARIIKDPDSDSELSSVIKDIQDVGGMWLYGLFGSKPSSIPKVLKKYGISAISVKPGDMVLTGTYIVSYWNGAIPWEGIHTITVTYDGCSFKPINNYGEGFTPTSYNCVCIYYLK